MRYNAQIHVLPLDIMDICGGLRETNVKIPVVEIDEEEKARRRKYCKSNVKQAVIQMTMDGEYVDEYPSMACAAAVVDVNMTAIHRACKDSKRFSAAGFRWKIKDSPHEHDI